MTTPRFETLLAIGTIAFLASPASASLVLPAPAPVAGLGIGAAIAVGAGYRALKRRFTR